MMTQNAVIVRIAPVIINILWI